MHNLNTIELIILLRKRCICTQTLFCAVRNIACGVIDYAFDNKLAMGLTLAAVLCTAQDSTAMLDTP